MLQKHNLAKEMLALTHLVKRYITKRTRQSSKTGADESAEHRKREIKNGIRTNLWFFKYIKQRTNRL